MRRHPGQGSGGHPNCANYRMWFLICLRRSECSEDRRRPWVLSCGSRRSLLFRRSATGRRHLRAYSGSRRRLWDRHQNDRVGAVDSDLGRSGLGRAAHLFGQHLRAPQESEPSRPPHRQDGKFHLLQHRWFHPRCSPFNYTLSAITTIMDLCLPRSSDRARMTRQSFVSVGWNRPLHSESGGTP